LGNLVTAGKLVAELEKMASPASSVNTQRSNHGAALALAVNDRGQILTQPVDSQRGRQRVEPKHACFARRYTSTASLAEGRLC